MHAKEENMTIVAVASEKPIRQVVNYKDRAGMLETV